MTKKTIWGRIMFDLCGLRFSFLAYHPTSPCCLRSVTVVPDSLKSRKPIQAPPWILSWGHSFHHFANAIAAPDIGRWLYSCRRIYRGEDSRCLTCLQNQRLYWSGKGRGDGLIILLSTTLSYYQPRLTQSYSLSLPPSMQIHGMTPVRKGGNTHRACFSVMCLDLPSGTMSTLQPGLPPWIHS
jgi:hypothetical protein